MKKLSVPEYFRMPESMRPMELVYGVVREPPAPRYGHQTLVTRLTALLDMHVREHGLGEICVSPVDVVLDVRAALVVQPDIIFVSQERLGIVRQRVWGAPDLVVEVLSPRTALRDRTVKVGWYRKYGVRECWLVETHRRSIEAIEWAGPDERRTRHSGAMPIASGVLPQLEIAPDDVFD